MPASVCAAVARALASNGQLSMSTAAHPIASREEFANPNVVKVVCRQDGQALYFSRAPIAWHRDGEAGWGGTSPMAEPLRHIGIYAYRVGFLRQFPSLGAAPLEQAESLEQLRALWHGHAIGVVRLDDAPPAGVDTPEDLQRVRAAISRAV